MAEYTFDQTLRVPGSKWEVKIDTTAGYGYFEHDIRGEGGGLWFTRLPGDTIWDLSDYDGVFSLPNNVAKAIEMGGHTVDADFYS